MPDLYAINLHLQARLEGDGLHEVLATEAARWLDNAGLLKICKNGFPLRQLLRAGRIEGQERVRTKEAGHGLSIASRTPPIRTRFAGPGNNCACICPWSVVT